MTVEEIHGRLRQLMEQRGISAYRLAELSGVTQSSIYNMFERVTMPRLETLDMMCEGMGVSLSDFFMYRSKPATGGYFTEDEADLLEVSRALSDEARDRLIYLARGMLEREKMMEERKC